MNKPRVLLFDLEVFPAVGYVWGKWEQDVLGFKSYVRLACFAYKWLGDKTTRVEALPDYPNEKALVQKLWELFNLADVVIAHNGNSYDVKMAYAYFAHHGLKPPAPFKRVDTKLVAKRHFRFISNKLDDLGDFLGLGRKLHTGGMQLWFDCMANKPSAWKLMKRYNIQDVELLEKVYLKLRPFMDNHPNYGILTERFGCPNCGSRHMQQRGSYTTRVAKYLRYQCQDCGSWSHGEREKVHIVLR